MGQLLVTLAVPPIVGIITYAVVRLIRGKDEKVDQAPQATDDQSFNSSPHSFPIPEIKAPRPDEHIQNSRES